MPLLMMSECQSEATCTREKTATYSWNCARITRGENRGINRRLVQFSQTNWWHRIKIRNGFVRDCKWSIEWRFFGDGFVRIEKSISNLKFISRSQSQSGECSLITQRQCNCATNNNYFDVSRNNKSQINQLSITTMIDGIFSTTSRRYIIHEPHPAPPFSISLNLHHIYILFATLIQQ